MNARRLKVIVSLHAKTSHYHQFEALAAQDSSRSHGFEVEIIYADGDALIQSQQLLNRIQLPPVCRPNVIMLDPFGSGMVRVAQEAVAAGIGWVVLNREVDYMAELRRNTQLPIFSVTNNHLETGRIQARQLNALLPAGGMALYLLGTKGSPAYLLRTQGMQEIKQPNIRLIMLNGSWNEEPAFIAVSKWLQLPTSRDSGVSVVVAQNDFMAMGARKAFDQIGRREWSTIKVLGCDGLKDYGLTWTRQGLLNATVVCPPLSARAMDILAGEVNQGLRAPALTLTEPISLPPVGELAAAAS
jgi:ribose transport system substrate-binding protein